MITLGPGSLFTSVIPNLLVEGIPAAIRSSPAVKAYFVNLMWQPGETTQFSASDHIRAIHQHAGGKFLDYAVVNIRPITSAMKKRYARKTAMPVENDIDAIFKMGLKVMAGNLAQHGEKVRHDPAATAAVVIKLAQEGTAPQEPVIIEMMETPVTVVILAAGLGTRMKSRKAKVLHRAGGKTLVEHVVDTALELAPPERIFVVVGHQAGGRAPGASPRRGSASSSRRNRRARATR